MRSYRCKIDSTHSPFTDLNDAIGHVIKEANAKGLDGKKMLGEYLEVIDDVTAASLPKVTVRVIDGSGNREE